MHSASEYHFQQGQYLFELFGFLAMLFHQDMYDEEVEDLA
jgi:hypothetical protein